MWRCLNCGEESEDNFDICPNCQTEKGKSSPSPPKPAISSIESEEKKMRETETPETSQVTVWEFKNLESEIAGEYTDVNSIREDFLSGKLAPDFHCRRKGEENFQPIKDHLAKEEFKIGVLFNPVMAHVRKGSQIGGGVIGCLGFIVYLIVGIGLLIGVGLGAVAFAPALVIGLILTALVGLGLGALIGLLVGLLRRSSIPTITSSSASK